MAEELTAEVAEHANQMLSFLVSQSKKDWKKVMKDTLDDKERQTNTANLEKKLDKLNLDEPVGAVVGGTGVIKEHSGLEGEAGQQAIQALKATGRLQQCGRGRGKCLIVLSADPLEMQSPQPTAVATQEIPSPSPAELSSADGEQESGVEMIEADNVTALTRAIRDNYRTASKRINELTRRCKMLEKQQESYEKQLDEHLATIADLESQLEQQKVGSWG